MKINYVITLLAVFIISCNNDEYPLISPEFKNIELTSGGTFGIPVLGTDWYIESITDKSSDELLLDNDGKPLSLDGYGEIEAANGWLTLTRNKEDEFTLFLKENLSSINRNFTICLNENGNRGYLTIIQKKGIGYKLVKTDFKEREELREIYNSDEECHPLTVTNNRPVPYDERIDHIFKDVVYSSLFESEDPDAFSWLTDDEQEIFPPDLLINGMSRYMKTCIYQSRKTTKSYITDSYKSTILLQPYTTFYLTGEATYCKRICNYIFTIENEGSGARFEISGIWTQVVPISLSTKISD